jgi:hypothetical protein
MTVRSAKGTIPVTSTIDPTNDNSVPPASPVARVKHVFTIASGYQVELPIELCGRSKTRNYYLELTSINPNIVASRWVNKTDSRRHSVHVRHIGKEKMAIPPGSNVAAICSVLDQTAIVVKANHSLVEADERKKSFDDALKELDRNPEFTISHQKNLKTSSNRTDPLSPRITPTRRNQPRHHQHRDRRRSTKLSSAIPCIPYS